MTKDDILRKWDGLAEICNAKKDQLALMTNDWLQDHIEMSVEQYEQEATKLNQEIDGLEAMMNQLIAEHTKMCVEEARKEQELKTSKAMVMNQFGANPDEIKVTGGVLSSNAADSHLIGIAKTSEQLEQERQSLLSRIKDQVMKKAITLGEASQWKHYINTAYGYSAPVQEMTDGMQR
jgi:hypothetical protein